MFRRVWTELSGWGEALSDPNVLWTLLWLVGVVATSSSIGILLYIECGAVMAVLLLSGGVLLGALLGIRLGAGAPRRGPGAPEDPE